MNPRVAAWLAWGSVVLSTCLFAAGAVLLAPGNAAVAPASEHGVDGLIWGLSWFGFGVVGALIVSRRPDQRLGWFMCGITLGVYVMLFLGEYAVRGLLVAPGSLPLALAAGWAAKWVFVPVLALVLALVLLFPTGTAGGRTARWLLRTILLACLVMVAALAVEPVPLRSDLDVMNPLAVDHPAVRVTVNVVGYSLAALGVAVAVRTVVRLRRARGAERQQLRWFAFAVVMFPVLFAVTVALSPYVQEGERAFDPVALAFFFGMNGIAGAIGVAVTRHGLYEIDRVVSRTVSYIAVTAILVGLYVASVVGAGTLVRTSLGEVSNDLVVAASTLAVAAAFGPVRRRVRGAVDRRFHRAHYDALRTVENFGHRLRDELDLDALGGELTAATTHALQPAHAGVWLHRQEEDRP